MIAEPKVNVHPDMDLANIEVHYGYARYLRCPLCDAELHRYVRDCGTTHRMYCRCVNCGAHYGYQAEENEEILRGLRAIGMGGVAAILPLVMGPVTLDNDPTEEFGGYGSAAD